MHFQQNNRLLVQHVFMVEKNNKIVEYGQPYLKRFKTSFSIFFAYLRFLDEIENLIPRDCLMFLQ